MDVVDLCVSSDESRPSSALNAVFEEFNTEKFNIVNDDDELGYVSIGESYNNTPVLSRAGSSGIFSANCSQPPENVNPTDDHNSDNESENNLVKKYLLLNSTKKSKSNTRTKAKSTKAIDKEREKRLKRAELDKKNSIKPGECMKNITAEIGSLILNKLCACSILEYLKSKEVQCVMEAPPLAPDNSIGWTRKVIDHTVDINGDVVTSTDTVREKFILIFFEMTEIVDLLINKSLNTYMRNLKEITDSQITLILYGCNKFFKNASNRKFVKENDLDYYLTKLLFEESVCCNRIETPIDLAQIVLSYTKSVAEIHFKKQRAAIDDQANFYMRGDNRECVQVDKDGNGLNQFWLKTFTKFPLVGLDKAHAICNRFPSPQSLQKFLQEESPEKAQKIISDIPIIRSMAPSATSRRIGLELAKKICIYYSATDGKQSLN